MRETIVEKIYPHQAHYPTTKKKKPTSIKHHQMVTVKPTCATDLSQWTQSIYKAERSLLTADQIYLLLAGIAQPYRLTKSTVFNTFQCRPAMTSFPYHSVGGSSSTLGASISNVAARLLRAISEHS